MNITQTNSNSILTFNLDGRLDTTTAPKLQEVLIPAFGENKNVELNFAKLSYVSSAGLRVLLMGQKTAKSKGAAMTICNASSEVMEVFEMTGFDKVITIFDRN